MAHYPTPETHAYIAALNAVIEQVEGMPPAENWYTGGGCSCIYIPHPGGGGVIIADALGPDDGPGDYDPATLDPEDWHRGQAGAVTLAAVMEDDWCDPIAYITVPTAAYSNRWADPVAVARAAIVAWRAIETRRPVTPDAPRAYRYAVGVDSAWHDHDIHDDPADAIAHAVAAAAERAARDEDDQYPVAVYLLPRHP